MGMSDPKVVQIAGRGQFSRRARRMAEALHGKKFALTIDSLVEDAKVVDAFAGLLDRAFSHALSKDGRLDLREAAIFVIRELKRNQK